MKRREMVHGQIEARGVDNPAVVEALLRVKRHLFVPEYFRAESYSDHPVPIGEGQTISQPYIVGLMTQMLELGPDDKVLEVGTGSGYQTAILAEIVAEVCTIEIIGTLADGAHRLLDSLHYENIRFRVGDGYRGWPEEAPFDGIVVTAAAPQIPQPLIDQLADGGRLVIPVGVHEQRLMVVTKTGSSIETTGGIPVRFVPMTGEAMRKGFRPPWE